MRGSDHAQALTPNVRLSPIDDYDGNSHLSWAECYASVCTVQLEVCSGLMAHQCSIRTSPLQYAIYNVGDQTLEILLPTSRMTTGYKRDPSVRLPTHFPDLVIN